MKIYNAKPNGNIQKLLITAIILLIGLLVMDHTVLTTRWWLVILIILLLYIPFYAMRNTHYQIQDEYFIYQAGITKGKIYIPRITTIKKDKTIGTLGTKDALTNKGGMVICFNKYSELYIAPTDVEALIDGLLTVKPDILVI